MDQQTFALTAFTTASSFVLLVFMLVSGRRSRFQARLDELAGKSSDSLQNQDKVAQLAKSALPAMGSPLMPHDEAERSKLQNRLIHAGLYGRQAMVVFLGVKMLLILGPAIIAAIAAALGLVPAREGLLFGACLGISGLIGPSFWLDWRKSKRQASFRRALPDALDVIVICLEGGLSLPAALSRVSGELRTAHPLLAKELNIVQREVQLGRSTGDAMRQFAVRADLEEVRTLASVVIQTERFGASLVKALRVHADSLRHRRLQYAEEMAQKAATKILFPTIFCILPGVFVVILGPAAIQIMAALENIQR